MKRKALTSCLLLVLMWKIIILYYVETCINIAQKSMADCDHCLEKTPRVVLPFSDFIPTSFSCL